MRTGSDTTSMARKLMDDIRRSQRAADGAEDQVRIVEHALAAAHASGMAEERERITSAMKSDAAKHWFWDMGRDCFHDHGPGHVGPTLMAASLWAKVIEQQFSTPPALGGVVVPYEVLSNVFDAGSDWCDDTEEENGHHPEWKALSGALTKLQPFIGSSK